MGDARTSAEVAHPGAVKWRRIGPEGNAQFLLCHYTPWDVPPDGWLYIVSVGPDFICVWFCSISSLLGKASMQLFCFWLSTWYRGQFYGAQFYRFFCIAHFCVRVFPRIVNVSLKGSNFWLSFKKLFVSVSTLHEGWKLKSLKVHSMYLPLRRKLKVS